MNYTVFGAVKAFDIFVRPFEFFVDTGIFNWQRNQITDRRQQLNIGLIKKFEDLGFQLLIPPQPLLVNALGAALIAGESAL